MGTITAPKNRKSWKWDNKDSESWIAFSHVNGLVISGKGIIDGQGSSWWKDVGEGDDCVAINSGCEFINITDVYCGPGHGISVGSLGKGGSYASVENIYVKNITFTGTTNGARIKTWIGGSGYARKISYEDIKLFGVKNPIIIDQQYDPYQGESKAVKVSDVTFRNFEGTADDEAAIELKCDRIGCTKIILENIKIVGLHGKKVYASCKYVEGSCSSCTPNVPCLS
ncbi:hypothetical protein KIW84_062052 [Lathyrus oleraceus]|uniref:Polygalacturonase n=1 Tax=Pisum sativum TaxID=3888 RepID=A0A9D5A5B0_PEA|nr:hypothetical protein KIW84_062052 [Pisum sativum]